MKRSLSRVLGLGLALAFLWAATAWPRLSDVETGRTPEYPDLQPRRYAASPQAVAKAVRRALEGRPQWTVTGGGEGPEGVAVQAVREVHLIRLKDDVTVRARREGGRTRVSVRSRSHLRVWDFGRNARNIRELLAALDAEMR